MRYKDNDDGSWTWTIPNPLNNRGNYRLRAYKDGYTPDGKERLCFDFFTPFSRKPLFVGDNFGCSPLHAINSKDAAKSLLGFLTLRPGDTDAEYFDDYTPQQLAWAQSYGCAALAAQIAE